MDNMPKKGIITAALLILVGIAGYVAGSVAGKASFTAFIPAGGGILILIGSLIGLKNLKLGMHIAALFGLLSAIAPLGRIIPTLIKGTFTLGLPAYSQIAMIVISGIFVQQCVKSFIDVRKAREAAAKEGQ